VQETVLQKASGVVRRATERFVHAPSRAISRIRLFRVPISRSPSRRLPPAARRAALRSSSRTRRPTLRLSPAALGRHLAEARSFVSMWVRDVRLELGFRFHHAFAALTGRRGPADTPLRLQREAVRPPGPLARLTALPADRRAAPVVAICILVVASLLAHGPAQGSNIAGTGTTDGTGQAANPRIVALGGDLTDISAIGDVPASEAPIEEPIGSYVAASSAPGPDAAADAGTARSGGGGIMSAAETAYAVDGSLIKPIAIDTSVPDISSQVEVYTVKRGDTLTGIANRFGLSMMTVWWANRLTSKDALKIGQKLLIPPVDGVLYKVREGDTLASVAKRFSADPEEIIAFNDLAGDTVVIGQQIMVPDGRGKPIPTPRPRPSSSARPGNDGGGGSSGGGQAEPCSDCTFTGSMVWPVAGGYISQYFRYGHPALDIAGPIGTTIRAADDGVVIFSGWRNNGGGYQVWISHGNNVYTTYNHMSGLSIAAGERVSRGQAVGRMGATGWAYGSHLHFEVWIGAIWSGGYRVNPLSYVSH
jgi:murein DD-endopeptidase MepM/ murein hydrolase activator NlpD